MKIDPVHMNFEESHELLLSAIVPRPIAYISTVDERGNTNGAPFSAYTAFPTDPRPMVVFIVARRKSGEEKDTLLNIQYTRDFVVNVVDEAMMDAVVTGAKHYPRGVSEIEIAGLTALESDLVKSPRVAESPVNMECNLIQIVELGESWKSNLVIGEIVRYHIRDDLFVDGQINVKKMRPIGRLCPPSQYCKIGEIFTMEKD
ncbi:MAG: flavin reductase family protein [Nitrososphaeria archaeon]|nr:flavin reductase family protein [Nitrososphaeria archaeon]NIN52473.1 flavin reductase family protein [Nitrososphaeria archaeon]NIQ32979.1 flavin reductase family protein [Nitrososphaeria archaeon]